MMTKLIEHTFLDTRPRMRLLSERDFDRYFNMLELSIEESKSIARILMYAAYVHGCIMIDRRRDTTQWHYLHRSAKYGDDLQLTTWDKYGPVSDARVSTERDFSYLMNETISAYFEKS